MCGIFATTRPDLWRDKVPEILRLLRHRGPDAAGIWENPDRTVLLAHTRLAIIGLGCEGEQPATLCSQHALTFNGEIYNYRELAAGLGGAASISDTQTLLRVLARRRHVVAASGAWHVRPGLVG